MNAFRYPRATMLVYEFSRIMYKGNDGNVPLLITVHC